MFMKIHNCLLQINKIKIFTRIAFVFVFVYKTHDEIAIYVPEQLKTFGFITHCESSISRRLVVNYEIHLMSARGENVLTCPFAVRLSF